MQKGQFIVIEGLEGAGKSTAMQTVKNELTALGIQNVIETREPGGTLIAEELRTILKTKNKKEFLSIKSELLLMYASRVQLLETVIKPALSKGSWVVGDRHNLSSVAYQGAGRGLNKAFINALSEFCLDDFKPALTFYIDIPPDLGMKRISQRGQKDRIEQEDLPFFMRVREGYLQAIKGDDSIIMVDGCLSLESVNECIALSLATFVREQHANS